MMGTLFIIVCVRYFWLYMTTYSSISLYLHLDNMRLWVLNAVLVSLMSQRQGYRPHR